MPFKRTTFMMKIFLPPLPSGAGTRSFSEEAPPLLPVPIFKIAFNIQCKVVQRFLKKALLVI
jgi:hypothetical protein